MNTNLPEPPAWFNSPGPISIADLTSAELWAYMRGRRDGYADGRADLEAEIEADLARRSVEIVHNLAKIPARDHAADMKRALTRDAWWADRRAGREEAA